MSGTLSQSSFQAYRGNAPPAAVDTVPSRPSSSVCGGWQPSYPLMARGFGNPPSTVETEFAISRSAMIESCGILSNMAGGWMDKLRLAVQGPESISLDDALTAAVAHRTLEVLASRMQTTLAMDRETQLVTMQKTFPRLAEAVASRHDVPQLAPAGSSSDSRSSCGQHHHEAESRTCAAATVLGSGRATCDDRVLSGGWGVAASSADGDSSDDDDDLDGFHFPSAVPISVVGVVPRREPAIAENSDSRDLLAPQRHVPALAAAVVEQQCKPVVAGKSGSCGKGLMQQRPQQQQQQQLLRPQQQQRPQTQPRSGTLLSTPFAQQRSQAQRPQWQRAQPQQVQAAKVPEAVMPTQRQRSQIQVPAPVASSQAQAQAKATKMQPRSAPARPQPKVQPKIQPTAATAAAAKAQLLIKAPPASSQARTQRSQPQQAPPRPGASSVEPNSSRPSYMRSTAASCAKALERGAQPPASASVEVRGCKARRVR